MSQTGDAYFRPVVDFRCCKFNAWFRRFLNFPFALVVGNEGDVRFSDNQIPKWRQWKLHVSALADDSSETLDAGHRNYGFFVVSGLQYFVEMVANSILGNP